MTAQLMGLDVCPHIHDGWGPSQPTLLASSPDGHFAIHVIMHLCLFRQLVSTVRPEASSHSQATNRCRLWLASMVNTLSLGDERAGHVQVLGPDLCAVLTRSDLDDQQNIVHYFVGH